MLARQTASHLKLRRHAAELARANAQLRELAIKDTLTGLPNRAFFQEALRFAMRQRRVGHPGLLFCDMNGFKQVNDRHGHHAGDELLADDRAADERARPGGRSGRPPGR